MIGYFRKYLSSEGKSARIQKKLDGAIQNNDKPNILMLFCQNVTLLANAENADFLTDFIRSYAHKVQDMERLTEYIEPGIMRKAVSLIDAPDLDYVILTWCKSFGFDEQTLEVLARNVKADDILTFLLSKDSVEKRLVGDLVEIWEKHNGDIRNNTKICGYLKNVAKSSKQSIPEHPRILEVVGRLKEAAELYRREGRLMDAASCFEKNQEYIEAYRIYENLKEREGMSRTAEAMGDYEKAIDFAVNPERKAALLIKVERFREAREFAAGLESPEAYFALIRETATRRLEARLKNHDIIGALELADFAEYDDARRKEIIERGRKDFDRQLAAAQSQEEMRDISRLRIKLEEIAGNFDVAGRIAEEVLKDFDLASLLYEKANLFNLAIIAASEHYKDNEQISEARVKLAELHEKGGNILSAADLPPFLVPVTM